MAADLSMLCNYKGTAYPVEQSVLRNSGQGNIDNVSSLVDLCCLKITRDATTTQRAVQSVPKELCYGLMKAAILGSRDRAIEVLVARWPWTVLVLRKFAPYLLNSIKVLYIESYMTDCIKRGVKYTTCLAHTFVECLKKRAPTGLKSLDLSGYPAAEVIVNYLSSHVLLVYNEARQKEIIGMYNNVAKDLPEEKRQWFSLDSTLPEESYIITLDAFLQTPDTHMELCRALQTSRRDECRFKLRLNKLDIMCLGVARISVLLELVDSNYMTGLCMQFNGLDNHGMVLLGPAIGNLKHLTALDLSCNSINVSGTQDAHATLADILARMLAALPVLKRLDMSNNRTEHKLRQILSSMTSSIEYLRLCGCGLSHMDLVYLQHSHHIRTMRELDISANNLGRHFDRVLAVLEAASPTLNVLEMEEGELEEEHFVSLFKTCKRALQNLCYWNISRSAHLFESVLRDAISALLKITSLRVLKLSYPIDCYISDDVDEVEEEKLAYHQRMAHLLAALYDKEQRPPFIFVHVA